MTKAEVINYWLAAGSGVIPIGENKKPTMLWGGSMLDQRSGIPKEDFSADYRWRNYERIKVIDAYAVVPQEAGFVVLDLDNHPGKDPLMDIHLVWIALFKKPFPYQVGDFEPRSESPSGGYHLWFSCDPKEAYITGMDPKTPDGSRNFEVKGATKYVLAPGSKTAKGEYRLVGNLNDAPPLPQELVDLAKWKEAQPLKYRSPFAPKGNIQSMVQWWITNRGIPGVGDRNNNAYQFATWCVREGVTLSECISTITPYVVGEDNYAEIIRTIEGRYNRG